MRACTPPRSPSGGRSVGLQVSRVCVSVCVYVCVHVRLHDLPLVVILWICKYQGYVLVCVCMYACMYAFTISLWWSFCGPVSIKGIC